MNPVGGVASAQAMAISTPLAPPSRRLEGKVALITGGANGIGESAARLLCRHGARVVVADIQDDKGEALCRDLGGPGAAIYVHCDVSDESKVRDAVDAAVASFGKLDIVFSNAAIHGKPTPLVETEKENFERLITVNLTGSILVTKHAARVMIPAKRGSIVITASTGSVVGGKLSLYPYISSKHAVVGLCKEAAAELGQHGIRVNCVSPYLVATELTRKGLGVEDDETLEALGEELANLKGVRLKAEDIAEAVLFLASDAARYVSGHNLVVDGGFTVVK